MKLFRSPTSLPNPWQLLNGEFLRSYKQMLRSDQLRLCIWTAYAVSEFFVAINQQRQKIDDRRGRPPCVQSLPWLIYSELNRRTFGRQSSSQQSSQ